MTLSYNETQRYSALMDFRQLPLPQSIKIEFCAERRLSNRLFIYYKAHLSLWWNTLWISICYASDIPFRFHQSHQSFCLLPFILATFNLAFRSVTFSFHDSILFYVSQSVFLFCLCVKNKRVKYFNWFKIMYVQYHTQLLSKLLTQMEDQMKIFT